ncbi:T9SS type A sorting domain-containing protein [Ichthyenterobacterium magnum]|uniref:Putative secreted protein (Por secretion system target) n=1 Tax=Ichthyenterobacterium magnum TaxID=1230530 RepID=A0A420DGR5_9FLAO|nr:T9SS type A sorting domain-containing protein [Ichthyenterobacterium magnum]RKE92281.1 putative secreted protein (Por secretion system target) [Ichthyenterobacterium magnum]
MKKLLLSLLLLFIATYITNAQSISKQVIGSSGLVISNGTHTINFTVGETIVGLIQSDEAIHQGFWANMSEETTLGIETPLSNTNQISVFPNPATSFIKVSYNENANNFQTTLYDITGKQLYHIKEHAIGNETKMDISHLPGGMYLLVLKEKSSNYKQSFKIIKK